MSCHLHHFLKKIKFWCIIALSAYVTFTPPPTCIRVHVCMHLHVIINEFKFAHIYMCVCVHMCLGQCSCALVWIVSWQARKKMIDGRLYKKMKREWKKWWSRPKPSVSANLWFGFELLCWSWLLSLFVQGLCRIEMGPRTCYHGELVSLTRLCDAERLKPSSLMSQFPR